MQAVRPADEDRLPWLEPYRETSRPVSPPRRGQGRPLAYGAGIATLLAVGSGGYWLGQRDEFSPPPSQSAIVALPAPKPAPAPVQVAEAPPLAPQMEIAPVENSSARKPAEAEKIRTAGIEDSHRSAGSAAQERSAAAPAPRPARNARPRKPSPGPAGLVIQLGAFSTAERAGNAYQARVTRHPGLAGMPRVIVPVVTEPDRRVLYALRLGTTSRQQSKTVCRNLRRKGDHCLVIG